MNDALGNLVIIGNIYGYSTVDNVIIGKATKFTPTRVAIVPTNRRFFRHGEESAQEAWEGRSEVINIASYHLFPIKEEDHLVMILKRGRESK